VAGQRSGRGLAVVVGVSVTAALLAGSARATPPGPPPVAGRGGPPPAWIETATGARWLAYSGYCWNSICVRVRSPATRTDLPVVRGTAGKMASVHFGFAARAVGVSVLGAPKTTSLPAGRIVSWRVARKGITVISATAPGGRGTVSYAVVVS